MKKQKIVIKFKKADKYGHLYAAYVRTDLPLVRIREAFDFMSLEDGTINSAKVKHTRKYICKQKLKSFFKRIAYVFKAIKTACSNDFNRHQYVEVAE